MSGTNGNSRDNSGHPNVNSEVNLGHPKSTNTRARQGTVMIDQRLVRKVQSLFTNESSSNDSEWVPAKDLKQHVQNTPKLLPAPVAISTATATPMVSLSEKSELVVFLVSYDSGPQAEYYELRVGRWIVSNKVGVGTCSELIEIVDPSVSAVHATIKVSTGGAMMVLDQFSGHGTGILRQGSEQEEEVTTAAVEVSNGDIIRFGRRQFHVTIIKRQNSRQTTPNECRALLRIEE